MERNSHLHHNAALLALAFLVNSTPSSKPTGRIVTLKTPMMTKIAYKAAALFGRTAHMREIHAAAMRGVKIRAASAR